MTLAICALALIGSSASASAKEAVDYFGTSPDGQPFGVLGGEFSFPSDIAVNQSGAGPANPGDIYVSDGLNARIQRVGRNDNGTPSIDKDDTYFFISAWGADVDSTPLGGSDYEVCTVAADCKAGVASGGNGATAGNGALSYPTGVAVDQDTGRVYVSDNGNNRVNVYEGDGTFVRSFGYEAVASGPGKISGASEQQQLMVKATGSRFSLFFRGETTGGAGIGNIKQDSKTVNDVVTTSGAFEVGQVLSSNKAIEGKYFPDGTTITAVDPGKLTLSQASPNFSGNIDLYGSDLPHNATTAEVEAALNSLPTIGGVGGSVTVTGGPGDLNGTAPYTIAFGGSLAGKSLPPIEPVYQTLTSSSTARAEVTTPVEGGAFQVCTAALGDVCQAATVGGGAGQIGAGRGIVVSQPDGNPATGTVFLADAGNHRVGTFNLDGSSPGSIGSLALFGNIDGIRPNRAAPNSVAVDSRGIVYASNAVGAPGSNGNEPDQIERYDSQNANGGGVGFLAPLRSPINETQELTYKATAGQYRLSFDPDGAGPEPAETTGDLTFKAGTTAVASALEALPSIGGDISVNQNFNEGLEHIYVTFQGAFAETDVAQLVVSNGATPLTGTITVLSLDGRTGPLRHSPGNDDLYVDPDADGPGPDTDTLYTLGQGPVQQFGPLNQPGLTGPPAAADAEHGTMAPKVEGAAGLALDQASGRIYLASAGGGDQNAHGIYVLGDPSGPPPATSLDSLSDITTSSVRLHGTINPNGPPTTRYHVEYSADGVKWLSTPNVVLGSQESPVAVEPVLDPPPFSLEPGTFYHVRLVAKRTLVPATVSSELTFTTLAAQPSVETVGAPVHTASTAQLNGRVNPRNSATEYHFEYGSQGPCDVNPCEATPSHSAGSGKEVRLAAEQVEGLQSSTIYHYRLVADNGNPGGPVFGADMTVTTRASDAPLSHGDFPGPPGSDRAYEQVSIPESSGNPVGSAFGFSTDGNRALYSVNGGTSVTDNGTLFNFLFAERTAAGWQSSQITPERTATISAAWGLAATSDLSTLLAANYIFADNEAAMWRLSRSAEPLKLYQTVAPQGGTGRPMGISADGTRMLMHLAQGSADPSYPSADPPGETSGNLFDVGSDPPSLISLLPGDIPACVESSDIPDGIRWISADGSRVYFPSRGTAAGCSGGAQLYMRDIEAGQSTLLSGPVLSGLTCEAALVRATEDAVFFWSASRLVGEDTAPPSCALDGDVYRYDLEDESMDCVTCVVAGLDADVSVGFSGARPLAAEDIAVAPDGSRVYFKAGPSLLVGAPPGGAYRIDVASGELAYVGQIGGGSVGQSSGRGNAISADGSVLVFRSNSAALNPLGGAGNDSDFQYYRYDDRDRSLICISCTADGSSVEGVPFSLVQGNDPDLSMSGISNDGSTIAFITSNPLVGADQNTPGPGANPAGGQDVYEWRDGRLFLVTDGLSSWPVNSTAFEGPRLSGVSRSGKDVYFTAPIQYTTDALDGYRRLYDARIGGGIEFPPPPKPCPLEVCQGTPKGAPEEQAPGTGSFSGLGNKASTPAVRCRKSQRRVSRNGSARCVAKKKKHSAKGSAKKKTAKKASDNRRAAR